METMVVGQPQDVLTCEGDSVMVQFGIQGAFLNYQWQVNDGSGWQNVPSGAVYIGGQTDILTITNPDISMSGYQYRCFVTSPCSVDLVSLAAIMTVKNAPSPSFTADFLGNGEFQFSNASNFANSFLWDFGDGTTSNELNPSHQYATSGTYTVILTAFNDCGQTSIIQNLNAMTTPVASFYSDVSAGCAPLTVQFFNNSSTNTEAVEWYFTGGMPAVSTNENPVVVFEEPGFYEVVLIAFNQQGTDTSAIPTTIQVEGPPVAGFNTTVNILDVNFSNTSLGATNGFNWDFGDGATSSQVNPMHSYQADGQYTVTLTANNECGESIFSQTISVGGFPFAGFGASFNNPCAPVVVQFEDQSSGQNLSSYFWEFEGGTPATSLSSNPLVTYTQPGSYDVTLIVTNTLGNHSTTMEDFVEIPATPVANFDFTTTNDTVDFINLSTGGNFWYWDFGDGNTSTLSDPQHIYSQGGVYLVTLTTGNNSCGSAISREVFIDLPNAVYWQPFFPSVLIYPNPAVEQINLVFGETPPMDTELSLMGVDGRQLRRWSMANKMNTFFIGELATGFYFIQIKNGDRVITLKFGKQ